MMDNNFKVNMNEYLPLRDVVVNTLRQAINNLVDLKGATGSGREAYGDPSG